MCMCMCDNEEFAAVFLIHGKAVLASSSSHVKVILQLSIWRIYYMSTN